MGPPSLFAAWPQVERRVRMASHWALILDFDGTLVPIVGNPQAVSLDPRVRRVLRRLAQQAGMTVTIMSGRTLADLRRHVKAPGVHLLGLHGWEERGARLPPGQKELLHQARQWLAEWLPPLNGILVEDKGSVLAVHYRGARPAEVGFAEHVMQIARDEFRPGLRLLRGKKVWEFIPAAIPGKGSATERLLEGMSPGTLPIVIGDDASDEAAFSVVRHGLAIHVGEQARTRASFCLHDPGEVREFLERLEAVISCKHSHAHSNS